jgi:hypothetical protein
MGTDTTTAGSRRIMHQVRQRIERGGEKLWRLEDFRDLPFTAVAQALSRLTRQGINGGVIIDHEASRKRRFVAVQK